MSIEQILGLLAIIGAMLGAFATIIGTVALSILSAIRADIHNISLRLDKRIDTIDKRVNDIFADRTDTNYQPYKRRRED